MFPNGKNIWRLGQIVSGIKKRFGDFLDVTMVFWTTQPGVSRKVPPGGSFGKNKRLFGGFPQKSKILAVHREEAKLLKIKNK